MGALSFCHGESLLKHGPWPCWLSLAVLSAQLGALLMYMMIALGCSQDVIMASLFLNNSDGSAIVYF